MPTRNSFFFQVAALSYQAPEMNGLECKLEGFDRNRYMVGGFHHQLFKPSLWKLYIAYKRFQQRWQVERDERVLDIHIRPPFYLSTWAYAGYTVLALCSLAAVIIYFRKQTRQKHQQAMDKFEREKGAGVVYCEDRLLHECGA